MYARRVLHRTHHRPAAHVEIATSQELAISGVPRGHSGSQADARYRPLQCRRRPNLGAVQWLGTLGGQAPHLGCGLARCGHPGHRGRCGPYTGAVARPAIHVPTPQRHPLPPSQPPPPPPRPPFLISVAGVRLVERLPRPCRWRCWRLCRGAKQQVVAASTTAGGGGTSVCGGNRFGACAGIVAFGGS